MLYTELQQILSPEPLQAESIAAGTAVFKRPFTMLMERVLLELQSENAQIVQSVLKFWKCKLFLNFFMVTKESIEIYMLPLISSLSRNLEPHWNPTVNKMTLLVLKSLMDANKDLFLNACSNMIQQPRPPAHSQNAVTSYADIDLEWKGIKRRLAIDRHGHPKKTETYN